MKTLAIDIETFCELPLASVGVYKYAADPSFEILLFAYAVDDGPVQVVDLARGEKVPQPVIDALLDDSVIKHAFNATFERVCLSEGLGRLLPRWESPRWLNPTAWRCSMIHAAYLGLPMSLDAAAKVLNLPAQKIQEGRRLIRFFCAPATPTKVNGGRTRNLPEHHPEAWARFVDYNARDVEVEQALRTKLARFDVPEAEWALYALDQRINDRGIGVDTPFAARAIEAGQAHQENCMARARQLTGLDNPNSPMQLAGWLAGRGVELPDLTKASVAAVLQTCDDPDVLEMLQLRQEMAKTSLKKYQAMIDVTSTTDRRARGLLQFYGANRTGRWAGRLIQVQNLPQNHLPDLHEARALVDAGLFDVLELLYPSVPHTLSELIRTAFVPTSPVNHFIVADFSAIEARVIAWLAGEQWRLDAFARGEDIYCSSASQMFGVPVVKGGVNAHLRAKGKVAELACGYGGSAGALEAMGALQMGLNADELKPLVDTWRDANPAIVSYWWRVDEAVKRALRGEPTTIGPVGFHVEAGLLFITLPSGRQLCYVKPRLGPNRFGGESVHYAGYGTGRIWGTVESYGPKFVENIVQATSRDILAASITRLEAAGHQVVMHVHDEVVVDANPVVELDAVVELMTITPQWAAGLPLDADAYECPYYQKD